VSLHDLDTVYGIEDMYDLLEIARINAYNRRVMAKQKP